MTNNGNLEHKRQAALQQLRERRKEPRRALEVPEDRPEISRLVTAKEGPQTKIELLRRYLEVKNSRPKPDKSSQVKELIENPFVQVTDTADGAVLAPDEGQEKRTPSQILLEQLGGSAFLKHMHVWLYNADTTFHPSSSTLEEIEQYRKEVQYRYNILKAALEATQKELEAIEVHVRAIKEVHETEENAASASEPVTADIGEIEDIAEA